MLRHLSIVRLPRLPATAALLLLACGGGSSPAPGGGGGPGGGNGGGGGGGGGSTVAGQIIDRLGQGLTGRTIVIGTTTATTDANGQFSISGVTAPYDLVILEPAPDKIATVYTQLTRLDPKLYDFGGPTTAQKTANLGGNIVGGDALPTPDGEYTAVSWGSPEMATGAYVTSSPYSIPIDWSGPSSTTGAVHSLQWTVDSNGTVTGYKAHAVKTGITLSTGGTVTNADLLQAAVLTDNVSATISAPSGYTIVERTLSLGFADGAFFPVSDDGIATASFSLPVPSGIGASATVGATASTSSAQTTAQIGGLAPGASAASLTLPLPALPTAPTDGATGVDTTTDLTWTPVSGALHLLVLSGSAADPTYLIVSGGSRARIPDLGGQGLALPSGHQYQWGLLAIGPYASIDAFAETGTIPREGVGFQTVTSSTFTTK